MLKREAMKKERASDDAAAAVADLALEAALDPAASPFASPRDALAMQRQAIGASLTRRLAVYRELLGSELAYIRDLATLHDVYETPFLHALERKSALLDRAEIRTVFCNYSEIQQIHQAFYDAVKAQIHEVRLSQLLAREFLRTANQFHLYSKYFAAYERALQLLNRLFRERSGLEDYVFLLSRDPRAKGLDLFSFLIKPIQVGFVCRQFCVAHLQVPALLQPASLQHGGEPPLPKRCQRAQRSNRGDCDAGSADGGMSGRSTSTWPRPRTTTPCCPYVWGSRRRRTIWSLPDGEWCHPWNAALR